MNKPIFTISLGLALASCHHSDRWGDSDWERQTSKSLCEQMNAWISAGPRKKNGVARKLILPDAYNTESYDEEGDVLVLLTAFAWDYGCEDNIECEDEADMEFRQTLRVHAHSLDSFGYFERLAPCVSGKAVPTVEDRYIEDIYLSGFVSGRSVGIKWDSEWSETQITVQYN